MRSLGALVGWLAGDVALSRLPWPWCVACLALWAILGMALLLWAVIRQAAAAVHHLRHRWANEQQLASGWLELGRVDEVARVLAAAAAGVPWVAALPGGASVAVWWLEGRADAAGVELSWPSQPASGPRLWRALFRVAAALDALARAGMGGQIAVEAGPRGFAVRVAAEGPPVRTAWYFRSVRFRVGQEAQRWLWQ